ncbi:MAG: hypothetical protein IPO88_09375 [Nannocystis sp.]|uniref:hypothetical protein n=1 Tax=Nannocystis sp. TaxID=1962667 RepID=UPI002423581C|nr:hypothetical protein [Nannocystis sp.]MBK9753700.1 hypothetical protein [Nannocystis sp.]
MLLLACGSSGGEPFSYPLAAVGAGAGPFPVGDWQVTLTRAEVAIGPIYVCATAAASPDLCDVALAEFTEVAVVDALAPAAEIGELHARPGEPRSAMLDYGISWFTTQSRPEALAALGHSARLAGTAVRDGASLNFDAQVDVVPPLRGSPALVGVRAHSEFQDEGSRLELRLDPRAWLTGVDFDALAASGLDASIRPGDPAHAAIAFAMTTQPPSFRWTHD